MDPAPPASCPRCREVPLGDQPLVRHCGRCKGSWIAEETLHAHVAEVRSARPGRGLTWRREARAALRCAICAEPMETLVVRDTPVDRCPRHGVWFDANELAHVLAAVAAVAPVVAAAEPDRESIVPELVEGGAELAIDAAASAGEAAELAGGGAELAVEAAEAGGGVFEVVIGGVGFVAEAVVDAIAGIFS